MKKILTNPVRLAETALCIFVTIAIGKFFIDAGLIHLPLGAKIAIGVVALIVFIPALRKVLK